jgi:phosphoglycolate phosphatase-like HAD superfamily hydrolase
MKERNGEWQRRRGGEWESGRVGDREGDATNSPTRPIAPSPTRPLANSPNSPSDLRILLWDIDGTLIHSLRIGAYKEYTIPVLEEVFGTSGRLANMRVSGMTDLQIIAEALRDEGFSHHDIREQIHHLSEKLTAEAKKVTGNGEPFFEVLPGVKETLEVLSNHPRYRSALVTGNIEPMAQLKMELVGLDQFFTLPGAFGDESHERRDLPERAAKRINTFLQTDLQPKQFIVIGDTPMISIVLIILGPAQLLLELGAFIQKTSCLPANPMHGCRISLILN